MSQQIEAPAGDAGTPADPVAAAVAAMAQLDEAPASEPEAPAVEAAPAPEAPPAEAVPAEPEQPAQPAKESLAELIRQQRLDRAARAAKEREAADIKAKLEEAQEKLAKVSKLDLLGDPIGYAQAAGLTEAEMALVGQAYLYHLVPEKAPPDLRARLLEAKLTRERKADESRRAAEERQRAEAEQAQQIQKYQAMMTMAAETWEAQGDSHPYRASKAWFGGNHDEYAESLVHTARNIAAAAEARGEAADLSIQAVAAVLERDLAARAARLRPPAAAPQAQAPKAPPAPAPAPGGKQPAVLSTRGQTTAPTPPAMTEEERIKRAIEAAFGA